MDCATFERLLADEAKGYKSLLETEEGEWIVKGFIDVRKNVYPMTADTKVVSKIIELILVPQLSAFAARHGLSLEFPSAQNFYPDLTFKDSDGNLFAVDFKSSYYDGKGRVNGLTLGSYWGYFRDRAVKSNTDYPYRSYKCHLVLGILYRRMAEDCDFRARYALDEVKAIRSVIGSFVFFVQPKWKIASDRAGSGNTRNIGSVSEMDRLVAGDGVFAALGEDVFDDYWMGYYNKQDARNAGIGKPKYHSLETYKKHLARKSSLLKKMARQQ
ncbi:MAG: restriction endonuclease [Kiritimatiellae bacterium]|nr:restriction endonuclease [Kiritimatiellia bacterium]